MRKLMCILDENVDRAVGRVLAERGHTVLYVTDIMGEKSDDAEIVAWAIREYAIITTRNRKHFHPPALAASDKHSPISRSWGLLILRCKEAEEARRVRELVGAIEREADLALFQYADGLLLHLEINDGRYIIYR